MKMENLTQEINSSLVIKSTKGFKFGINQPYIPQGGRKVLQSILDKGGLLEYDSVNFIKPIN